MLKFPRMRCGVQLNIPGSLALGSSMLRIASARGASVRRQVAAGQAGDSLLGRGFRYRASRRCKGRVIAAAATLVLWGVLSSRAFCSAARGGRQPIPSRVSGTSLRSAIAARGAAAPGLQTPTVGLGAGPLWHSEMGQRAWEALQEDPEGFSAVLTKELQALQLQQLQDKETVKAKTATTQANLKDSEWSVLRHRIQEVQRAESTRALADLMHIEIVSGFQRSEVPLVEPLAGQLQVDFGPVDLKQLASLCTGMGSDETLELLKGHVLNILKDWDHLTRDYPLRLAMFQVGQVYSMSVLFGYSLRQVNARYRLEKVMGSSEGAPAEATGIINQLMYGTTPTSMKDYVSSFGPQDHHYMLKTMSAEAEAVIERQVSKLCGDLTRLTAEMVQALEPSTPSPLTHEDEIAQLRQALVHGEVQSVTLTVSHLRRLALEGAAFGFLLGNAESRVGSVVDLSPGTAHYPLLTFDGDGAEEDADTFLSQGFRILGA